MKIKKVLAAVLSATMLVGSMAVSNVFAAADNTITWQATDGFVGSDAFTEPFTTGDTVLSTYKYAVPSGQSTKKEDSEGGFARRIAPGTVLYSDDNYTIKTGTDTNVIYTEPSSNGVSDYTLAMVQVQSTDQSSFTVDLKENDEISIVFAGSDQKHTKANSGVDVQLQYNGESAKAMTIASKSLADTLTYKVPAGKGGTYTLMNTVTSGSPRIALYKISIKPAVAATKTIKADESTKDAKVSVGETATVKFKTTGFAATDTFTVAYGTDGILGDATISAPDANGVVTVTAAAAAAGSTTVKLSSGTVESDTATVTVKPVVAFKDASKTLEAKETVVLVADAKGITADELTSSATVEGIVEVESIKAGSAENTVEVTVKGVKKGDVTLSLVSKTDDTVKSDIALTVTAPEKVEQHIKVSESVLNLNTTTNKSAEVTASLADPNNIGDVKVEYEWDGSKAPNVEVVPNATDSSKATITAKQGSEKEAVITVKGKYKFFEDDTEYYTSSASVTVNVESDDPYLTLYPEGGVELYPGQSAYVRTVASNVAGVDIEFNWGVKDTAVDGAHIQVEEGQDEVISGAATITAKAAAEAGEYDVIVRGFDDDNNELVNLPIKVVVKALPEFTLTVDPATDTLAIGEEKTFEATATAAAGATAGEINWTAGSSAVTVTPSADKKTATIKGVTAAESVKVKVTCTATVDGTDITIPKEAEITLKVEEEAVPEITAAAKSAAAVDVKIGSTGVALEADVAVTPEEKAGDVILEYNWTSTKDTVKVEKDANDGWKATVTVDSAANAGETDVVTLTVTAKDNTAIEAKTVEFVVTVKPEDVTAASDVFDLTAVVGGEAVTAENGVFALPGGTKEFDVVVKTTKDIPATNSITATLNYDTTAFTVKSAEKGTLGDIIDDEALASAIEKATAGTITIANFAHTATELKNVTIAKDTVLATFTFSVAAGSETGADFTIEAIQFANKDFVDTVTEKDSKSIKVSAKAAAEDEYYYLLADVNQDGVVNVNDGTAVLTNVVKFNGRALFTGYENVMDVAESGAHVVNTTDATTILKKAGNTSIKFDRAVSNDIVEGSNGGAVLAYVPITKEVADAVIAYNGNALTTGTIKTNLSK